MSWLARINARFLGVLLAIGWVLSPIPLFFIVFLIKPERTMDIALSLFALPFIVGTTIYTLIACKRCVESRSKRRLRCSLLFIPLSLLLAFALFGNLVPRRLTPDMAGNSPFDKAWFTEPQFAVGSPYPYWRHFDAPQDQFGSYYFSFGELIGNFMSWSFPIYVAVSIAYLVLPRVDREHPAKSLT